MARPPLKPGTHGNVTYTAFEGGRVEASAYARDTDGTRRRMKASGSTEAEARDALVAKITLHNAGLGGSRITGATTLEDLGTIWLLSLRDKSAVTMETYTREVKKFITPALGILTVAGTTPAALETFLASRPGSAGRVSRVVLRNMFALAITAGARADNPVQSGPAAPKAAPKRALTRVEYQRLLTHIKDWQEAETDGGPRSKDLHDQVVLLLATGVDKVPEMLAAAWEDIDLNAEPATWHVTGTVERSADRGLHVRRYASDEARMVKLAGSVELMLRRRRATLGLSRTGLVFQSRAEGPIDPANWRRTFAAACGDDFAWVRPRSLKEAPSIL